MAGFGRGDIAMALAVASTARTVQAQIAGLKPWVTASGLLRSPRLVAADGDLLDVYALVAGASGEKAAPEVAGLLRGGDCAVTAAETAARPPRRSCRAGSAQLPWIIVWPADTTIAGTGEPAPAGIVMNMAVSRRTGTLFAITLVANPLVGGVSCTQGAGPAAVANGQGVIGTATSEMVITGAPATMTVGAVDGMNLNVPP